jgi:GT2 family glycosyltransferase
LSTIYVRDWQRAARVSHHLQTWFDLITIDLVKPRTGVVIPTMGTRPKMLKQCLHSVKEAGSSFVVIVGPDQDLIAQGIDKSLYDFFIQDPNCGLAAAIDAGIRALPESAVFVNWLGDDDLLTKDSHGLALEILEGNNEIVLVYGGCEYIDENGALLWKNRSGKYASALLHFGPQLIPQPGALMRRSAYIAIGGLDPSYKWAFDLDMLIRLKKVGRLQFIDATLAKFRWHEGSLSVGGRKGSVNEASFIRRKSLPKTLQLISPLWEIPMRFAILAAGDRLNRKLMRLHE